MITKPNFSKITALVVDDDHYSTEILQQILRGFGLTRCTVVNTAAEAKEIILKGHTDLIICEATIRDEKYGDFIGWLRKSTANPIRFTPVVMLTGYTQMTNVTGARDNGANSVVKKPVSPKVLFDHLVWSASQERPFVETEVFSGPDRRFKFIGPPDGVGRRDSDVSAEIGAATAPNMTQQELDSTFKPTRVSIE